VLDHRSASGVGGCALPDGHQGVNLRRVGGSVGIGQGGDYIAAKRHGDGLAGLFGSLEHPDSHAVGAWGELRHPPGLNLHTLRW
jgi:hypothetical protein